MNKENAEIKRLTLENEGLANRIEDLDERLRDSEGNIERLKIELENL